MSEIGKLEATFTKPLTLDEDAFLQVEGIYPTKPSRVRFSLAYLYETPDWRLVKINVYVEPEPGKGDASD